MEKRRYTIAEHRELGAKLKGIRDTLQREFINFSKAYPLKHKSLGALHKAQDAIDKARSVLDDVVCQENPSDDSMVRVYYPGKASVDE